MEQVNISEFFENEYVDFSVYDNVRKIASYIDGQKNSSRKVLHTLREQNINSFLKVSNLGPKVQDHTQYLHGSLEGVIVNMTADYVTSGNNIPLLQGDGNFGSRFIQNAAATRYIFARQNSAINKIYLKDDTPLLDHQYFEGDKIEPKFYVPILPMLLVNGSEGMSIGFAQKILPRNPKDVIAWVNKRATGVQPRKPLVPYWNGQDFTVEPGENPSQWIIKGAFERVSRNKIRVTSLPVGYDLKGYHKVLDRLVDDKVIRDYDDLSDDDVFLFELSCDKDFVAQDEDKIMSILKLVKTISENFTCVDENNKIVQFDNANEVMEAWYQKRIEFNQLRKEYILKVIKDDMRDLDLKRRFIQGVVDGDIELRNKSEPEVTRMTVAYDPDLEDKVKEFMNLPMRVLTKEEIKKLDTKLKELYKEYDSYGKKTFEMILQEDVKNLESVL